MSFEGRDHFTDRIFRKSLKDLDVGKQDHLWEGINNALDEDRQRGMLFSVPWVTKWIIGLSLVSFSLLAAYKSGYYFGDSKNKEIYDIKNDELQKRIALLDSENEQLRSELLSVKNSLERPINEVSLNNIRHSSIMGNQNSKEFVASNSVKGFRPIEKPYKKVLSATDTNQNEFEGSHISLVNDSEVRQNIRSVNELAQSLSSDRNLSEASKPKASYNFESLNFQSITDLSSSSIPKRISSMKFKEDPCNMVERKVQRERIYIDFYYAPEFSKRTIDPVFPNSEAYATKRKMDERFVRSYSTGIRGSYVFKNGIALRTGLNYSEIKERFDFFAGTQLVTIVVKDDNGNPIDTVTQEVNIVENIYNRYKFYDLPIVAGYEINLQDFMFSVNGGVAVNLIAKRSGSIYAFDNRSKLNLNAVANDGSSYFKDNVGLSLVGSFGLNYKLSRGMMLLAEPAVRYYLGAITKDNYPLKQKYLQFGLIAGIRYQIVK